MSHDVVFQFSGLVAEKYGHLEACLIWNFQYWIRHNRDNEKNFREGRTWSYNTVAALHKQYFWTSPFKIRRALEKLEKDGVLIKGHFSERGTDRTTWYAFADEEEWLPDLASMPNRIGKGASPFGKSAKSPNSRTDKVNTDEAAKPAASRSGRGSRLTQDWKLPLAWGEWALKKFPHWTAEYIRETVAVLFRNHWVAKSGRDASKTDWEATWQNWCIKEEQISPFKNPAMPAAAQAGGEWWKSKTGIEIKAAELGLQPGPEELFPHFKDRVYIAAGDGPWMASIHQGPTRSHSEPVAAVAASIKGNLKAALKKPASGPENAPGAAA